MKTIISVTSVLAALTLAMLPAKAQVTYFATGNFDGSGADGKAISDAVVNNDASTITFTIDSSQTMASWIFYAIDIQIVSEAGSGSTVLSNPIWAGSPTLGISTGMNSVLNDNGGTMGAYTYSGGTWTQNAAGAVTSGGTGFNTVTMTVPLSSLGLSVGDSFYFDVVSSYTAWSDGGPQSAYGALDSVSGYPAETDSSWTPWNGTSSYDSATDAGGTTFGTPASEYTVIPEPTTLALLSGGVILLLAQRRRV